VLSRFPTLLCWLCVVAAQRPLQAKDGTSPWSALRRWAFEVESEAVGVGTDASKLNPAAVCRVVAATSNDELYYLCWHRRAGTDGIDWSDEPFNIEITLRDGKVTHYHKFNRSVEFSTWLKGSEIPGPIGRDPLFLFVPGWPLRSYPPPVISLCRLLQATSDLKAPAVRTPRRELIGGEWCTEFRSPNGHDRFWLADKKGYCVMQREWVDSSTGEVKERLVTRRIAEITPHLWMPVEVESRAFGSERRDGEAIPISRIRTRVVKWKLGNDVPQDLFNAALAPGTIEMLSRSRVRQISPGGFDHLDHVSTFARRMGLPETESAGADNLIWVLLGLLGGVFFGLFATGFKVTRLNRMFLPITDRWHRRRAEPPGS
jgi:hypothetical protein